MQGTARDYCNAAIEAVLAAAEVLWGLTIGCALQPRVVYGKRDTLGMDALTEIAIGDTLRRYDSSVCLATEESGQTVISDFSDPRGSKSVFVSDPTDRSSQLCAAIRDTTEHSQTVAEVVRRSDFQENWVKKFGGPVEITGSTTSVSCIRRGVPIFSVVLNLITRELFVACNAGVFVLRLPEDTSVVDLDRVCKNGCRLYFRENDRKKEQRFVTFLGKSGYNDNF